MTHFDVINDAMIKTYLNQSMNEEVDKLDEIEFNIAVKHLTDTQRAYFKGLNSVLFPDYEKFSN